VQISHSRTSGSDSETGDHRSWRIECQSNTWSHQRRRRRQMMRSFELQPKPADAATFSDPSTLSNPSDDTAGPPDPKKLLDVSALGNKALVDTGFKEQSGSVMTSALCAPSGGSSAFPTPKRMRLDPLSLATEDSGDASYKEQVNLSVGSGSGSPNPKRLRLDPSTLDTVDSGKPPIGDSGTDNTTTSVKARSDQSALHNSADPSIKDSVNALFSNGNVANPVTSVTDLYSTNDSAERSRLDPVSDKDSSFEQRDRSSDSESVSVESKPTTSASDLLILVCDVTVRKADLSMKLELAWVDGANRELMHQLMQFFKNCLVL